ncbi:hypothetical protein SAMN05216167_11297 [Spirosoma endophyticum]|uniref:Uncharacterized protein n=1 Tax=Spirosoma endophyticum TaxID=662367 RepID=A0A1I1ZEH3_9BACT|nr:hypothetical protein SAMN05216167_11297 [Spirosoma endophyticum]
MVWIERGRPRGVKQADYVGLLFSKSFRTELIFNPNPFFTF